MESKGTPSTQARASLGPTGPEAAGPHRLFELWLVVGLLVLVFSPTVAWLWYRWTLGIWYSAHAILVPPVVAYLIWQELRHEHEARPASAAGFVFLLPSLVLVALDSAIRTQILSAVALVLALPGLSLLLLGAQRTRRIAFPLVITWMMLPIPAGFASGVHLVLRHISAEGSALLVPWLGIPVHLEGTLLHTPGQLVLVADACSGFSTLYAAITTALILAHWSQTWSKRIVLMGSAVGLAIVCNTIRVAILVLLIQTYGSGLLETPVHELSGILTFGATLVLLFAIAGKSVIRGTS